MTLTQKLFGFQGRLRRRDLWILWIACTLTTACLVVLVTRSLGIELSDQQSRFLPLLIAWPVYALLAKRMHDRNRSAWWALLLRRSGSAMVLYRVWLSGRDPRRQSLWSFAKPSSRTGGI